MSELLLLRRKALRFLKSQVLAVVATCGDDKKPRAALVAYLVDDDFNVWFVTHRDTRKFDDLQENPNVGISVGFEPGPWTVQMTGVAKLQEDGVAAFFKRAEKYPKVHDILTGGGFPSYPFAGMQGLEVALFRVRISEVQVLDLEPKTKGVRFRRFTP